MGALRGASSFPAISFVVESDNMEGLFWSDYFSLGKLLLLSEI